jgi:hypothetical protein
MIVTAQKEILEDLMSEANDISNNLISRETTEVFRKGKAAFDLTDPKYTSPERDPVTGLTCVYEAEDGEVTSLSREPLLECTHSEHTTCHYTYVTKFESISEEVCEEVFEKKCQITFDKEARNETVKQCYRPMEIRCGDNVSNDEEETCRTVTETFCTTRYVEKMPGFNRRQSGNKKKSIVADTRCEKIPVEICGKGQCKLEQGPEECREEV